MKKRPVETVVKDLPDVPEWEQNDRLAKEKEVLGFYLSSHPLAEHAKTLQAYCSHTTVEAAALKHRTEVMLGGMIASIKHSHTKNPKPGSPSRYAMFDLEDTAGIMRCICWPEQFAQFGELIQPDDDLRPPRRDRQAARQRRGQPDHQRSHPPRRPGGPLYPRHPRPRAGRDARR